ncbi:MAG: CehA/McbA family metallohydrolase [Candidatus Hadarchaeaceae archaeon]
MLQLDLHVHTRYSYDGNCSVEKAVEVAKSRGMNGIAITDHDTVSGHGEAKKINKSGFLIIPGTEISSAHGHIVGLGVNEAIPKGLPATDTVELIRDQGGIAIAAHPFALGRSPELVYRAKFDAIECLNSRAIFLSNPLAQRFARKNGLVMVAGSDAHQCGDIGMAFTLVDCELDLETILEKIKKGKTSIAGRALSLPDLIWRVLQKAIRRRHER